MWCIPKQQSHHFVAGMERVLKVYQRPYDSRHPVVCMDEMSKQLVSEVREKLPVRPGSPEKKYDAHYLRRGECTVWMFGEPLSGWRTVAVTKRRTTLDWAKQVRALANLPRYRDAESITLVCDNLNTHSGDSFYAAFPAAEASRLNDRIHLVHTPKHGSWLNVAGTGVQCVAPPVPGSPDREQGFGHVGNGGLGQGAQSRTDRGRLAAQRRRRAHQTEASIPEN